MYQKFTFTAFICCFLLMLAWFGSFIFSLRLEEKTGGSQQGKNGTTTCLQAVVNIWGEVTVWMSTSAYFHLRKAMTVLKCKRDEHWICNETMTTSCKSNCEYLGLILVPTSPPDRKIIACFNESSYSITKGPLDILFENTHRGKKQGGVGGLLHCNEV